MKSFLLTILVFVCSISISFSQNQIQPQPNANEPIQNISEQITKIAKSVESLNKRLKTFSDTFSSNQGLKLSDKQQELLFAFELINRAEESLSTLQKLKIDLTEKRINADTKLLQNQENARAESIDRSIALRGTTDAEGLRENRRQILSKERQELNELLNDITNRLAEVNRDIQQTEQFIKRTRNKVFSEAEKALKDF
jgi:archaellum component FlaC